MTAASPVYGCHNRPRPTAETSYVAQAGFKIVRDGFDAPWRVPALVTIKHTLSTNCRYDLSAADQRCAGCAHGSQP